MAKSTPIPQAAREAVMARQQGRCLRCGTFPAAECHHRQRRKIGGHGLENLVYLCKPDHDWAHANPRAAREEGFIVSNYAADISTQPVSAWDGWHLLHPDGTTTAHTEEHTP